MAKKQKPAAGTAKSQPARHRENIIQRAAEEVEARFFEGAEQATDTTSAETNAVLAALAAIQGPHDSKPKAEGKPRDAKRKSPSVRFKKR